MKRFFSLVFIFALAALAFAVTDDGTTVYWQYGERPAGPEINTAFERKLNAKSLIASPATTLTASNAITVTANYSFVKIQDNATDSTNALTLPSASEGQLLFIFNGDASATSGLATISTQKMGMLMYASAGWKLLADE